MVDSSKTLLENLRNRFVQNHPCFIVTLNNQFDDFVMLSEEEAKELSEMWRISPQQLSGGKVMHRQNKVFILIFKFLRNILSFLVQFSQSSQWR